MTVDPPAFVLVWVTVVKDAEVGVLEVVDDGSDVVEGVEDVDDGVEDVDDGVLEVGGFDVVAGVVEMLDCEVDAGNETVEEVD